MHGSLPSAAPLPALVVENVCKAFGGNTVLRNVSLHVESGAYLALLGPSGCGKTTLLRLIAGLERPDSGRLSIQGRLMAEGAMSLAPEQRGLGMVFQSYALWPHMSVADNIGFGLRLKGLGGATLKARIDEVLALVGLEGLATRRPAQLSGGQRQRVALARSLAPRPPLLLLDEPLANLDAHLRDAMLAEFRHLHRETGTTFIHVTHDQSEAMALATHIAVMDGGRLEQIDRPDALYAMPATAMVARFIGNGVIIPVAIARQDGASAVMLAGRCLAAINARDLPPGEASLCLRPDNLLVTDSNAPDALAVDVTDCLFRGGHYALKLRLAADPSIAIEAHAVASARAGDRLGILIRSGWLMPTHDGQPLCA